MRVEVMATKNTPSNDASRRSTASCHVVFARSACEALLDSIETKYTMARPGGTPESDVKIGRFQARSAHADKIAS
jgi:hypothetical protein